MIIKRFEKDVLENCVKKLGRVFDEKSRYYLQMACFYNAFKDIDDLLSTNIIIADRYIYSILSYYRATSFSEHSFVEPKYKTPDIKVLLTCNAKERERRVLSRKNIPSERKKSTFGEYGNKVYNEYLKFKPWLIINTNTLDKNSCMKRIILEIENAEPTI